MAAFTLNTHRAYLNTDVIIRNNTSEPIVVKDTTTSDEWVINEEKTIRLSAGIHQLVSEDTSTSIVIEDAVKFGGSRIKNAFAFDNNPWSFVTTKDRFYAVNILTGEERVEFSLTPDMIASFEKNDNSDPCEYFLFNNKQDFSIYNVETAKIIITFPNHIFSNDHLIIYSQGGTVRVYDYRLDKTIVEIDGQYSIGNKFFFVKERKLYGLNLRTSYINSINEVGELAKDYLLYDNCLVKLKSDYSNAKVYEFFWLGNDENNIKSTCVEFPYYVELWEGHTLSNLSEARNELDEFKKDWKRLREFPHVLHHVFSIRISNVRHWWEKQVCNIILSGTVHAYPSMLFSVPFTLSGVEGETISFRNCIIEAEHDSSADTGKVKEEVFELPKEEKLLGRSPSGNIIISSCDNRIVYRNIKEDTKRQILENLFDYSYYVNAFFTSDGKNVVFENIDKDFDILGFEDLSLDSFNVEGMTVPRRAGFNGYKPEIVITSPRKPVWRDPISLVKVREEDFSNHIFKSADGKFTASTEKRVIYKNRITGCDISIEEYIKLCKDYDFSLNDTDDEKEKKIALRKKLLKETGQDILFEYVINEYSNLMLSNEHISEKLKKDRFTKAVDSAVTNYLNKRDRFTPLFIDPLGYVIYNSDKNAEEKKILIGRSVYFLNYISFSYNSRYLAFGAKMKRDDFRYSEDGVFVIYDLKEEKEIVRLDNGQNLYAVWMTMFSKNGDVAFYDSKADAYIVTAKSCYKKIKKVEGMSLLCYSPSGRYIAFSDQNYIDYTHHPLANWGHQPSGNIFIHDAEDVQSCLEQFNDFGEGICGVASHFGNVASVAFSCDEKRLMAVGDDGVVVVRNLHLDMQETGICESYDNDDYGTHYGEYAGSYAQDVMGYSDDVINDAFDGDPDAYWNID